MYRCLGVFLMIRSLVCLSAALLACTASVASATTTVGGIAGVRTGNIVLNGVSTNGAMSMGQTFSTSDSLLTNFAFQFASSTRTDTSASVTFSLLSASGTTLASSTTLLTGLQFRTSPAFSYYDVFNGSVALTPGETYSALVTTTVSYLALVFSPNTAAASNAANDPVNDAYAAGAVIRNNAGDIVCSRGICDANFRFTSSVAPVAAVPESATWVMMLAGFGLVGGGLRYRRRATGVRFA